MAYISQTKLKPKGIWIVLILFSLNSFGQDSLRNRNSISITPLSLFDRNLSLSYYWKIKDNLLLQINPRFRLAPDFNGINAYGEVMFLDSREYLDTPFPFSRVSLRNGLLYYDKFFIEPIFQYEYGFIKNEHIFWADGDDYVTKMNITYHSVGTIITVGAFTIKRGILMKYFCGLGAHYKYFRHEYVAGWLPKYITDPPIEEYGKIKFSAHWGFELGINFK